MRKALILILMAATAAIPFAAADAQDHGDGRGRHHSEQADHSDRQQHPQRAEGEARPQRQDGGRGQRMEAGNRQQPDRQQFDGQRFQAARRQQLEGARQQQFGRDQRGTRSNAVFAGAGRQDGDRSQWRGDRGEARGNAVHIHVGDRHDVAEFRNQRGGRDHRGDNRGGYHQRGNGGNDRSGWQGNHDHGSRGANWNREWRHDRRYDWQNYRYSHRNIYHSGRYYAPYRGYGYNRLAIGLFLDEGFYASNYWIGDPFYYRLPPAEPGTRWVRYYNDVVLVDVYSGEVVDVIYDFFW
jgi:hypothetical protein